MTQPNKIETKTSPFSLPKSTINSIQMKNVKRMKYTPRSEPNYFYIAVTIFIAFATGLIVYVLLSLSQLQKLSGINSTNNTTTVEVNDTVDTETDTITQTSWASREVLINNNIVWKLQLPSSFIELTAKAAEGVNYFSGEDNGSSYRLQLAFPLFTNYPDGEPETLSDWIKKELSFMTSEESITTTSESFTLGGNIPATLVFNMREITQDSGNARIFGTKKSLVLYISKTKTRNFSKITLILEGTYNEESARAVMERIASSIKI